MANYHVVKKGSEWGAKKEGAGKFSGKYSTQKKAEQAAKTFSKNSGGGEVIIHGRDGKIRDSDTVAPGNDPNPPKDKKY